MSIEKTTAAVRAEILADYQAGILSVRDIARKHGVSPQYPTYLAEREGVAMRGDGFMQFPATEIPEFPIDTNEKFQKARFYLKLSVPALARIMGKKPRTIRAWEADPDAASSRKAPRTACLVLETMVTDEKNVRTA